MAYSKAGMKATDSYKKRCLHRIPVDVKKEYYEEIKAAAEKAGQSVSAYIKQAVAERMERESDSPESEEKQ